MCISQNPQHIRVVIIRAHASLLQNDIITRVRTRSAFSNRNMITVLSKSRFFVKLVCTDFDWLLGCYQHRSSMVALILLRHLTVKLTYQSAQTRILTAPTPQQQPSALIYKMKPSKNAHNLGRGGQFAVRSRYGATHNHRQLVMIDKIPNAPGTVVSSLAGADSV
jgi:hypothetical protein